MTTKPVTGRRAGAPAGAGRDARQSKAEGPVAPGPARPVAVISPEGNDVGVDPHKKTLTASVLDCRGGVLGTASFAVSGDGHRALETWVANFGPVRRFGIEGASGLGRHSTMYLVRSGHDVRDVCPNRTNDRDRARRQGKTDAIDSVKIAREVQADPELPAAFKRAGGDAGPDETTECLSCGTRPGAASSRAASTSSTRPRPCWWRCPRRSAPSCPTPPRCGPAWPAWPAGPKRTGLATDTAPEPASPCSRPTRRRRRARPPRERDRRASWDASSPPTGSTLSELVGIAERSDAELLVEVGDPRRFASEGGFARFNGTAPLPASSAEGDGQPTRHRLNRGGNRRVNAVLHRMAVTQLRCEPRAQAIYDNARSRGHTKKEAMRILKRHLSNVVYRRMMIDQNRRLAAESESSPQVA